MTGGASAERLEAALNRLRRAASEGDPVALSDAAEAALSLAAEVDVAVLSPAERQRLRAAAETAAPSVAAARDGVASALARLRDLSRAGSAVTYDSRGAQQPMRPSGTRLSHRA